VTGPRDRCARRAQASRLTRAPIPNAVMMAAPPRFTQRRWAGVMEERRKPTPVLSRSHQNAEPRKTPATMSVAGP
jgi:hypothetical protein